MQEITPRKPISYKNYFYSTCETDEHNCSESTKSRTPLRSIPSSDLSFQSDSPVKSKNPFARSRLKRFSHKAAQEETEEGPRANRLPAPVFLHHQAQNFETPRIKFCPNNRPKP